MLAGMAWIQWTMTLATRVGGAFWGHTFMKATHHNVSTIACNGCHGTKELAPATAGHYLFYKYFLNYQRFLISTFYAWLQRVRRGSRKRKAEKREGRKRRRGENSEEGKNNKKAEAIRTHRPRAWGVAVVVGE